MTDFLQANFLAVALLFFLSLLAIVVSKSKNILDNYGQVITFVMIALTLLATLLLLEDSYLQELLIKALTVASTLFGCVILFKYLKFSSSN